MVAGDLVNTSSRVQSAAEPGTVLVGEATKRATEAAVAYADAGTHDLKGKERADPAVPGAPRDRGRGRRAALVEPGGPLRGRDRELRLVKELFHATRGPSTGPQLVLGRRRRRSRQVPAAPGSSRSTRTACGRWPGGTTATAFPTARASAYWALAEMVRMRCGITEDEEVRSAPRASSTRRSGARRRPGGARVGRAAPRRTCSASRRASPETGMNLFAAWRLFFERLCRRSYPVVIVFEDMQWADAGLLDVPRRTCSTGRATTRSSSCRSPVRSWPRSTPTWGGGKRSVTRRSTSSRSPQRDGEPARRPRPGPARELRTADPRPRRGHPALCRRDRSDAARPRAARPRRGRLSA